MKSVWALLGSLKLQPGTIYTKLSHLCKLKPQQGPHFQPQLCPNPTMCTYVQPNTDDKLSLMWTKTHSSDACAHKSSILQHILPVILNTCLYGYFTTSLPVSALFFKIMSSANFPCDFYYSSKQKKEKSAQVARRP